MNEDSKIPDDEESSAFEKRARALFADRVATMDAATRSELTQARHAALQAAAKPGFVDSGAARWWLPAGGLAGAALAAMLFLNVRSPEAVLPGAAESSTDDMEIVASADNLDLLENVDFYVWMDSDSESGSSGSEG